MNVLLNRGNGTFAAAVEYPAGLGPYAVVAADLNGDAAPDLAVAARDSARVEVLLNHGDGTFAAAVDYIVGLGPEGVAAADLNGDGRLDLVSANSNAQSVSVLLNQGDVFATAVNYATDTPPAAVTALDFNGDGKVDLATASLVAGKVELLLNLGNGTFGPATPIATGIQPTAIHAADFNGDGRPDLAFTDSANTPGNVKVLLNPGVGALAPVRSFPVGKAPSALVAADFNKDGRQDLAVANELSDSVSVLLGGGNGEFGPALAITGGSGPSGLSASDLNGDGSCDLAVANYYMSDVSLLLNSGTGTFASPSAYATAASPRVIKAVDVNADGLPDMVTANFAPLPQDASNLEVRLNLGGGVFGTAAAYPVTAAYGVAAGDLNGDGRQDLIAPSPTEGLLNVSLNLGDGTFAEAVKYPVSAGPIDVAVADVNRDGRLDVVYVTGDGTESVGVLLNSGQGILAPPVTYAGAASAGTDSLVVRDFDDDGWPDVALPGGYTDTLALLYNRGDGTFEPPATLEVPSYLQAIRAADLDGDHDVDLILTRGTGVAVLLNRGARMFAPAVVYAGSVQRATEAVDLNNDGQLDLATPTDDGVVNVRLNRGDGTFGDAYNYDGHAYSLSLAAADLNSDGRSDLMVANTEINTVTVLLNSCLP